MVLCELASSFFVGIDTTDGVAIETSSAVLLRLIGLGSFFGLRLLLIGETEGGLLGECGVRKEGEGLGGTEESCEEVQSVDH